MRLMRFISRKDARQMLGGISAQTFWRMQKLGLLPPSVDAPGKPFREDQLQAGIRNWQAKPTISRSGGSAMTASANDNTTSHMMPLNDILTLCQELLDRKRQTVTTVELINMACALLAARIVMGE